MSQIEIDDAGALIFSGSLVILPPVHWSDELRRAYIDRTRDDEGSWMSSAIPSDASSPVAWDQFNAEFDRRLRPALDRNQALYPVEVNDTQLGGIRVGVLTPSVGVAPENAHRVIIHLHGGSFLLGSGLAQGTFEAGPLAAGGRFRVITVDYRQAPFHAFPAATDDVEAVYRQLLADYAPESIGIVGGSAGGVIAAQALARFQRRGLPRPAAAVFNWSALAPFGRTRYSDPLWGDGTPTQGGPVPKPSPHLDYFRSASIEDPEVSPLLSDELLSHFPASLFVCGTRSLDLSPAVLSHSRLLRAGVDSYLYVVDGGWHGIETAPEAPETQDLEDYRARWFRERLA